MGYLDDFYNFVKEYYETENISRAPLRNEIEPFVLTGGQILESGIADFSERQDEYKGEIEELETEIEKLKSTKNYAKWRKHIKH